MPGRAPRSTSKQPRAASVRELEVIMQAGIAAFSTGSQDSSNAKRRAAAAMRRAAKELGVMEPDLTDRVVKHMRDLARGHQDLLPDPTVSQQKLQVQQLLEQESDFAGEPAPRIPVRQRRAYGHMEEKLPKPPQPAKTAKARAERARKARGGAKTARAAAAPPPPGMKKGCPPTARDGEVERRVHELVRRMGLGATRKQLRDWAKENWSSGTSDRNIDEYIAAARAELRANWHRDREDFMVDLLEQYQRLAGDARANDQLNTALGCLNSMAKLANMGGFSNSGAAG